MAEFAVNWGYAHDYRLMVAADLYGANVKSYTPEVLDEIVCDV